MRRCARYARRPASGSVAPRTWCATPTRTAPTTTWPHTSNAASAAEPGTGMGMEDTRLAAARELLAVDRTEAALRAVHQVLADQPSDADAWCLLAMCHRQGGDI